MTQSARPIYLDCNATTPIDPRVREIVVRYLESDYGNAGSRTHSHGHTAALAVSAAREEIAAVVNSDPEEVILTSGATEANNLAILGLREYANKTGKKHIVTSSIEHKAVLEPLRRLESEGFNVEFVQVDCTGVVRAEQVLERVKSDTLLVSVMHANNETGIINPIEAIAEGLDGSEVFFHVDAAQTFGKLSSTLCSKKIDAISLSAHKFNGPKGVGALVARREKHYQRALRPVMFGGGQERGLRSGTTPVHLVAGMGRAATLLHSEHTDWARKCGAFKDKLTEILEPLGARILGETENVLPNTLCFSLGKLDSEYVCMALKDQVSISNGAACTSDRIEVSHVLKAMQVSEPETIMRWSWCHLTPEPNWANLQLRMIEILR